jgi:hypothetical protein
MKINKLLLIALLTTLNSLPFTLETIYGWCEITEPVLIELISSQAFNRLKLIRQYGVDDYIRPTLLPYSRHTHSLGVLYLLRHFGADLKEQVAGLLHDVSHTVFSHVGDHVSAQISKTYFDQNADAYQDQKHIWLLSKTDIPGILTKYGITLDEIDHKSGHHTLLEKSLPDLCVDRLEYNLYGGYVEGWLTKEEMREIINHLHHEGCWYFDDEDAALKIGTISLRLCQEIFSSQLTIGSYHLAAQALLRAVEINLLTMHDINFGTDDAIFAQLQASQDPIIKHSIATLLRKEFINPSTQMDYDLVCQPKFRGIDPWVKTSHGLEKLSSINPTFQRSFFAVKKEFSIKRFYKFAN